MIPIDASNGGGLVPEAEVFEALGAFLLKCWPAINEASPQGWTHGFEYRGRIYRAEEQLGYHPAVGGLAPVKLHFDYIREAP